MTILFSLLYFYPSFYFFCLFVMKLVYIRIFWGSLMSKSFNISWENVYLCSPWIRLTVRTFAQWMFTTNFRQRISSASPFLDSIKNIHVITSTIWLPLNSQPQRGEVTRSQWTKRIRGYFRMTIKLLLLKKKTIQQPEISAISPHTRFYSIPNINR